MEKKNDPTPDLPDVQKTSWAALRQEARLPCSYERRSAAEMTFDARLPFEIALQMEPAATVFERYGYTSDQAVALAGHPTFKDAVAKQLNIIKDQGLGFRTTARVMAEDLLNHAYEMATDADAPASVRADLIKWTAKMADLEPKPDAVAVTGGGFGLQIIFTGTPGVAPQQAEMNIVHPPIEHVNSGG